MVKIIVQFYDHNTQAVVERTFWGKDKEKAQKRWREYEDTHRHQEVRSVTYSR